MSRTAWVLALALWSNGCCTNSGLQEEHAAARFNSIRQQPALLVAFLRAMPKGGDLHNHLSGAIYAETLIGFAAHATPPLCFDPMTGSLVVPTRKACVKKRGQRSASEAYDDPALYRDMIDAFSMRDFVPHCDFSGDGSATRCESGHDHFFATFPKFGAATDGHTGDMLAEATQRAAADHLQYLELMHTADGDLPKKSQAKHLGEETLGTKPDWSHGFAAARSALLGAGLTGTLTATRKQMDQDEAGMRAALGCGTAQAEPGCDVQVRYLYQVGRGNPSEQVFAQILLGFELAQSDRRVVGLNLVMPEDFHVPMRDFKLHMRMLDYLHGIYPKVHISLHAGELAMGLVPPEGLRFHIRDSVRIGHAERIGHGVDITYEDDRDQLLKEMAGNHVLVEICLTSNDGILGVRGLQHPLKLYLDNKVPVTLATDDEGVSRSDMTHEYLRAAQTYEFLQYKDLKRMARMSMEHSFLPGVSLWAEPDQFRRVDECANDHPDGNSVSPGCQKFLSASERATGQWKLEEGFVAFEKKF